MLSTSSPSTCNRIHTLCRNEMPFRRFICRCSVESQLPYSTSLAFRRPLDQKHWSVRTGTLDLRLQSSCAVEQFPAFFLLVVANSVVYLWWWHVSGNVCRSCLDRVSGDIELVVGVLLNVMSEKPTRVRHGNCVWLRLDKFPVSLMPHLTCFDAHSLSKRCSCMPEKVYKSAVIPL